MTSSNVVRWGGMAAILGGVLLVAKGLAIIFSDADPSFVPPATLLFALGMVGPARPAGRTRRAPRHGRRLPCLGRDRRLGGEPDRPGAVGTRSRGSRRPCAAAGPLHGGL